MPGYKTFGGVGIGPTDPSGSPLLETIARDLAKMLNHLIHLARDLTAATEAAARRLEDDKLRDLVWELDGAHDEMILELGDYVVELGQGPARRGDMMSMVERARVALGRRKGDRGVIQAMAANEESLCSAYRRALATPHLPVKLMELLRRGLAREEQHVAYYNHLLGRFVG
jgi:uncharacterized protein (TIGR02284 family)